MSRLLVTAVVALVTATASPYGVQAPDVEVFDPASQPLAQYFTGPNAVLTEEQESWRASICAYETRDTRQNPDDALSGKNAVGRCQVMVETARRFLGFRGPTYALFFRHVNEEASKRMEALCLSRRGWKKTLLAVAYCYHGGHRRVFRETFESWEYALAVERFHLKRNQQTRRPSGHKRVQEEG